MFCMRGREGGDGGSWLLIVLDDGTSDRHQNLHRSDLSAKRDMVESEKLRWTGIRVGHFLACASGLRRSTWDSMVTFALVGLSESLRKCVGTCNGDLYLWKPLHMCRALTVFFASHVKSPLLDIPTLHSLTLPAPPFLDQGTYQMFQHLTMCLWAWRGRAAYKYQSLTPARPPRLSLSSSFLSISPHTSRPQSPVTSLSRLLFPYLPLQASTTSSIERHHCAHTSLTSSSLTSHNDDQRSRCPRRQCDRFIPRRRSRRQQTQILRKGAAT
jgi:hypothetical protein